VSVSVILRAEAEADINQAHEQLETVRIGLGQRFKAGLRRLIERVEPCRKCTESCGGTFEQHG
jgi:hypothetical protein